MKYIKKFNESINSTKYFVCHRFRGSINLSYAKEFLENERGWNKITIHDNYEDAKKELDNGFYDDSDYAVIKIENDIFYIKRGSKWITL